MNYKTIPKETKVVVESTCLKHMDVQNTIGIYGRILQSNEYQSVKKELAHAVSNVSVQAVPLELLSHIENEEKFS